MRFASTDDYFFDEQHEQGGIHWLSMHLNVIERVLVGRELWDIEELEKSSKAIRDMNISFRTNNTCDRLLEFAERIK